jgi:predicted metal-binding protein
VSSDIAIGKINDLKGYLIKYDQILASMAVGCSIKTYKRRIDKINNILKDIFNYESFRDNKNNIEINHKHVDWNRHKLISLMDITTCPYCNRQYVTNYIETDNNKTTADLDHFYPQSKYPFLALSLYNFIPSCQICNSRFKGDQFEPQKHIYPYDEEFGDDAKFEINSETMDHIWDSSSNFKIELSIKEECKNVEKIKNSINTFKIEKVYQTHKDYAHEIIKKAVIYNDQMIKDLLIQYPDMFKSKDEVWQCLIANYITEENLGKRPLAKLTKDICEQYGIKIKV